MSKKYFVNGKIFLDDTDSKSFVDGRIVQGVGNPVTGNNVLIDDKLLREPNLLTPSKKPVGNVVVDGWRSWGIKQFLSINDNRSFNDNGTPFQGGSYLLNGSSDYLFIDNSDSLFNETGQPFTAIIDVTSNGSQINFARLVDCKPAYNATTGWTIESGRYDNAMVLLTSVGSATSEFDIGEPYIRTPGARVILVVTWDGNDAIKIYRGGNEVLNVTGQVIYTNTTDMHLGRYAPAGNNWFSGFFNSFSFLRRAVSDAEAASLSIDPYQILKPAGSAKQINRINFQYTPEEVLVDDAILREPNLLTPAKKPVGNVEIDWDNPLSKDYIDGWANNFDGEIRYSLAGREYDYYRGVATAKLVRAHKNADVIHTNVETSSAYGVAPVVDLQSDLASGKTITFLTEIEIYDSIMYSADASLLGFTTISPITANSFSWLDHSGGILRIAVYTAYDTTNTISSVGRYIVGFKIDPSGNYQTYFNGLPSQSGVATRRPTGRYMQMGGIKGRPLISGGTDLGPTCNMFWAHTWFRGLSDGEVASICADPYQILKPAGSMPEIVRITAYSGEEPEPPVGHPSVPWMSFF